MGRNVDGQGLAPLGGHGVKKEQTATVVQLFERAAPERGDDVERINQFSFYELGQKLRAITIWSGDVKPTIDILMQLWAVQRAMDDLVKGDPIPVTISKSAAQDVTKSARSLVTDHFHTKNDKGENVLAIPGDDAAAIPEWRWNGLKNAIGTFETVFSAEMKEATTYYVPRRGIFWTPALVDSADDSFPKHVLPLLPGKTRQDWCSAGRCLAFNLLSASGFHVARAVEGTIELYYQLYAGKPGVTLKSWQKYYDALEKIKTKPGPSHKTLAEFRQMKDDYRNPIMHPRVVLTESDARMLFDNGESLIIAMGEEIKTLRESAPKPVVAVASDSTAAKAAE